MSGATWITRVFIVDLAIGRTVGPRWVLLDEGRIEAILDREPVGVSGPTVEAAGLVLAPGLIDSHVHLFLDAGPDPMSAYRAMGLDDRLVLASANARSALDAGITTVRDLGGPPDLGWELLRRARSGEITAPSLVLAGSPLTRRGGHLGVFGGEIGSADAARALVAGQHAWGARAVKVIASGGGLTPATHPDEADLPLEIMRAAVEAGHALGVGVTAHCHATAAIARAVEAGIDMVEHASFVEPPGVPRFDPDVAARLRDAGVAVGPTAIGALRTAARYRAEGRALNPDDVGALARLEARLTNVRAFHRLGLRIVGGTDAGVPGAPFDLLLDEILGYVSMGLSLLEALRTVTIEAAAVLRLGNVGEVAQGLVADLVLLERDPLLDLEAYRRPLAVWRRGDLVVDRRDSAA